MYPGVAILVLWFVWAASWAAAAFWADKPVRHAPRGPEAIYRVILLAGLVIFAIPARGYAGPLRLWFVGLGTAWLLCAVAAAGFAFTWWARLHLGRLWSGSVTRKADHRVVDTGPYGLVRHPIYTGLLLATYATALMKGTVPGLVGAVLITIGLVMKARLEERFLREELGPADYDAYAGRTPMLVPFSPL